ncbi:adhesin [Rhodanobacter sp. T12-5]|uniref:adhesin n=1 Tax=Rhodanobacter sp. T12-5 TaxID=2024611 RepID=UPI0011EBBAF8|nr:adhesin [Rhodanobacter sp. T12-5]KAA0069456.1 adhesin [Rhodanobacter sp. T12-5]
MSATFKKTLLAMAVATLFSTATAYAHNGGDRHDSHSDNSNKVRIDKKVELSTDISLKGDPRVQGNIDINAAAIAIVDNKQSNAVNEGDNTNLTNNASASGNVAGNASGNIGVNIGSGDNNQQDNAAALSAADASFAFGMADGEVFVNQQGLFNDTVNAGVTNSATVSGNAFQNASGNLGVNVTSGNNNQQKNAMAAAVATTRFAQSTVASDQASGHNSVSNAGYVQQYNDTVDVSMSGAVQGYSLGLGLGGYAGHSSGSYSGSSSSDSSGMAYQASNLYPDSWNGATHPSGNQTGHIDFDNEAQGAVQNPNRPGVGGFAFDTSSHSSGSESGTTRGTESGGLGFVELSANDLYADLSGTVTTTRWVVVDATNTAGLSGNAFQNASGNIGINVASGSGNQQANSLAMAVAQPGAGGTGGGE